MAFKNLVNKFKKTGNVKDETFNQISDNNIYFANGTSLITCIHKPSTRTPNWEITIYCLENFDNKHSHYILTARKIVAQDHVARQDMLTIC